MESNADLLALNAFRRAAACVPAYQTLLREAGVAVEGVETLEDFRRLPVLQKRNTFQRFAIGELCVDGLVGRLGNVLTSSGHSGNFAFGLTETDALEASVKWIDDALDAIFAVRSHPTLLINCLPMGVKVPTRACTLADTSVRPDMAVALVKTFGQHFAQIIILGEAAFLKLLLESGPRSGVDWRAHLVHLITGEETLAENARRYLQQLLGHNIHHPENGMVFSSMGVAELGLNIFFEVPPTGSLVLLRRTLHESAPLREAVLGSQTRWVPSLFTYDPRRIFVEFDPSGRLILTTLDPRLRLPLIRYATGDQGFVLQLPSSVREALEAKKLSWDLLQSLPLVALQGRGDYASAGESRVYPEAVKEGLYHNDSLAASTTANFRLLSGSAAAVIRIQLSPGIHPDAALPAAFHAAISNYVDAPYSVTCEAYESFGSGMGLDYERKFQYLGK